MMRPRPTKEDLSIWEAESSAADQGGCPTAFIVMLPGMETVFVKKSENTGAGSARFTHHFWKTR